MSPGKARMETETHGPPPRGQVAAKPANAGVPPGFLSNKPVRVVGPVRTVPAGKGCLPERGPGHRRATGPAGPTAIAGLAAACLWALLAALPGTAAAKESAARWRLGPSVGLPQLVGLTAERRVASPLCLQMHAGSVFIVNSAGARALLMPPGWRCQPYAFGGGGFLYEAPTDTGEAEGWTGYGWWGGGLRLRLGRLTPFAEVGRLEGMYVAKGFDHSRGAVGAGVLWAF